MQNQRDGAARRADMEFAGAGDFIAGIDAEDLHLKIFVGHARTLPRPRFRLDGAASDFDNIPVRALILQPLRTEIGAPAKSACRARNCYRFSVRKTTKR
jgi:hypothetical protein